MPGKRLPRRQFLRGGSVAVALPLLDAMTSSAARPANSSSPTRLLCVGLHLGLHGPAFFPKEIGPQYKLTRLLQPLADFRDDFTVFSGLDHPRIGKGHPATVNFLTGVDKPQQRRQPSFDQVVAAHTGRQTRFASLHLAATRTSKKGGNLSWAPGGVAMPQATDPRQVFLQLFARPTDIEQARRSLNDARSVLDHVLEDVADLKRDLGSSDRGKLDEYLTAIREVEREITKAESFVDRPRDAAADELELPEGKLSEDQACRVMLELARLAFQADLTRVATLHVPGNYHPLSHHGGKPGKIRQLVVKQQGHVSEVAGMIRKMAGAREAGARMLDHTVVLLGSGMGNASTHSTRDLPILVAGGGLRHLGHQKSKTRLSNLFVTLLQRAGVATERFSNSTGNFNQLLS